jgi:large subunit ribosomal protein L25
LKERVVSKVPVVTKGDSPGVQVGGVLEQHLWEIKISCLPMDIPEDFRIDVSTLNVGDFLHVSDLSPPEKVTIEESPTDMVLAIIAPRKENEGETSEDLPSELEVTSERKSNEEGS